LGRLVAAVVTAIVVEGAPAHDLILDLVVAAIAFAIWGAAVGVWVVLAVGGKLTRRTRAGIARVLGVLAVACKHKGSVVVVVVIVVIVVIVVVAVLVVAARPSRIAARSYTIARMAAVGIVSWASESGEVEWIFVCGSAVGPLVVGRAWLTNLGRCSRREGVAGLD